MPVNPANWSAEASYTLALVDFSSISDPDPRGEYRHYLNNGVQVAAGEIDLSTGTLVTSYAGALRLRWKRAVLPELVLTLCMRIHRPWPAPRHWPSPIRMAPL